MAENEKTSVDLNLTVSEAKTELHGKHHSTWLQFRTKSILFSIFLYNLSISISPIRDFSPTRRHCRRILEQAAAVSSSKPVSPRAANCQSIIAWSTHDAAFQRRHHHDMRWSWWSYDDGIRYRDITSMDIYVLWSLSLKEMSFKEANIVVSRYSLPIK